MVRSVRPMAAAAAVTAVALCGTATTSCSGAANRPAARATQPAPSSTLSDLTAKPSLPTSPASMVVTAKVSIGPMQLTLPHGWRSNAASSFTNLCIGPPGKARPGVFGCDGLAVWYGWDGYLPGNEEGSFDRAHPGWYRATDVEPCPVDPTNGPDHLNGIRDDGLVGAESLRPVGNRKAYFYQWRAHCDDGYRFSPRAWYLPASKLLVFDYLGTRAADAILGGATFDGSRWTLGFLRGATRSAGGVRLALDEAEWLGGDAANDYAEHHGMETPVPNDYLIVDPDTSTTSHLLTTDARIVSVFALAGTEPGRERVVSVAKLIAFLSDKAHQDVPFHVHLDPAGRIDRIVEQYRP